MSGVIARRVSWFGLAALAVVGLASAAGAQSFVAFESGQVRPLAMSPDGNTLFAVNTPDNRLEVFAVSPAGLTHTASVDVGMEPVAVAARSNSEVWVVNHLSDSVSIVDVSVSPPHVVRTLLVGDEPRDIVFAGTGGNRAFITTARRGQNLPNTVDPLLTTEGIGRALVFVFDATNLGNTLQGTPLTVVELFGDTPRALAVSPDGATVYAAVFHSGNQTTTVTEGAVCNDTNLNNNTVPGPCNVGGFTMPGGLPLPERNVENIGRPETGLIVKFDQGTSQWRDQLSRNWNNAIRFDLPDFDVFKINANGSPPQQIGIDDAQFAHVGTVLFDMIANPVSGKVYVSNTEAKNEVRFEGPGVIGGSTVRGHLHEARITVLDGSNVLPRPLNKHINYSVVPSPPGTSDSSLATPVGLAINATGTTLYVTGFGSQRVGVYDVTKLENNTFTPSPADGVDLVSLSGGGPVGLALDENNDRLYVLTRFDNSISVVDTNTLAELPALKRSLYNPEPFNITDGRRFLYDANITSSNGEASCSSCHVFGNLDDLAWDLGNPDDTVLNNPNPFALGPAFNPDFHPMKGPMTTQSLRGMANHGPMHWRGDRTGGNDIGGDPLDEHAAFEKFNVAFEGLLGRTGEIAPADMTKFTDFILDVHYPPNPIRALDNSLTSQQQNGRNFYFNTTVDTLTCNGCHTLDENAGFFGGDGLSSFENEPQHFKVAHLRNAYTKIGMFGMPAVPFVNPGDNANTGRQIRGYGYLHDGSIDSVFRFLHATVFTFPSDTVRREVEAFVFAMDSTMRPVVGQQVTLTSANSAVQDIIDRLNLFDARSNAGDCDVVVKGTVAGLSRGWWRQADGSFQSDRDAESEPNAASLRAKANTAGQQLTFTAVPPGSGTRMGVDRDEDGYYDRDELDSGSDPANPLSIPAGTTAVLIPAKKMLIKNKLPDDESKNKIIVLSKSPSITTPALNSSADPRCNADPSGTVKATIEVSSTPGGQSLSVPLPCQNWKLLGSSTSPKGYKYADPELDDGVVKLVMWKTANQLKATFFGKGATTLSYDLQTGVSQSPVQVKLTNQNTVLCMACNGAPGKDGSDGKIFQGKDCPAPVACN
jgi:DNA-binding beta-propeller fold protein YncE